MITGLNRVNMDLLKVRHGIDSLNLETQQLGVDLHSLMVELKRKNEVGQHVVSIEDGQHHEGNKMNLDLPSCQVVEEEVAREKEIKHRTEDQSVGDQEEETEKSMAEEHGKEVEGLEEIVKQAKEGDLLIAKRPLIGFQRVKKEPKEEPFSRMKRSDSYSLTPPSKFVMRKPHKTQSN